ncbi:MAG: cyclic nucleotide-binding domain-containing protein [Alphaproteobacteria bacterium]|nr:cyclic nucleotide-binding domain-containing protein [Alphaproteobacteria bacterium]
MSKHDVLKRISLNQGEIFIKQGEFGNNGYVIQSGQVEVFLEQDGDEITLAVLGPGEVVGEQAVLFDASRSASVRALTNCNLVVMDRDAMNRNIEKSDPSIRAMIKILSERLKRSNNTVAKSKTGTINNRKVDAIFKADKAEGE